MRVLPLLFCGSWLASDGGLPADQALADCTRSTCRSEPARDDGRPDGQRLPVELNPCGSWLASDGGLPADQALADCTRSTCRSEPARDGGRPDNQSLTDCTQPLWELACQRWRPESRPSSRAQYRSEATSIVAVSHAALAGMVCQPDFMTHEDVARSAKAGAGCASAACRSVLGIVAVQSSCLRQIARLH